MPAVTAVLPVNLVAERVPDGGYTVSSITTHLALYHVQRVDEESGNPEWCWVWLHGNPGPLFVALEPDILAKRVNDYWNGIA